MPRALELPVWSCSRIARFGSAYFVVAPRRKACPLAPFALLAPLAEAGARLAAAFLTFSQPAAPAEAQLYTEAGCSLVRPGQRRASLAQHGGRAITDARSYARQSSTNRSAYLAQHVLLALTDLFGTEAHKAAFLCGVSSGLRARQ